MIKRRFIGRTVDKDKAVVEKEEYHHLVNVHRARKGDNFFLITREGKTYRAKIIVIDKKKRMVLARLNGMLENNDTSERSGVIVAFALFSENRLRYLIEKATEIGVEGFLPFVAERSKRKIFEIKEGWYKVVKQAVKQSKRNSFPEIMEVLSFDEAVEKASQMGEIYVFDVSGEKIDVIEPDNKVSFAFIGPEGGFTEREKEILKNKARGIYSLGQNVLRTETAAIIGAYELIKAKNKRR